MNFLNDIKDKTLLIIPNNLKNKILEEIDKLDKLVNIKLMTLNEFKKNYFFDYNEETIYYIYKNYNTTVSNAKLYLENMYYIINTNIKDSNITYLKNIYNDLKNNNLLKFNIYFKEYLNNINIIVLDNIELYYQDIFNKYNTVYYNLEYKDYNNIKLYHFNKIEEEIDFVFNKVSELIKNGVNINNIKFMNITNEYIPFIKRMSKFYKININNLEKNNIKATVVSNKFLDMIKNKNTKEEILEFINKNLDKEIFINFLNIINKYYFIDDLSLVIDLIKNDLENIYIKESVYLNAIDIIEINSYLVNKDDYVFLLGFNMENIPKIYKDIDYLNDNLKEKLGLYTSLEKNKLEKEKILNNLKNINNLIITYKDIDPYKSYYPSNLIESLNIDIIQNISIINKTSNIYNKIKLVNQLDLMLKYGTKFKETSTLLNTYQDIPYLTYNNKFTGINNKLDKITLSYTSLNNYYHCSFRYYIDSILKLNIYEGTFKIYIGNLFHYILSKIFLDDFNFENEFLNFTKTREFTKKELFYLNILKEELIKIIEVIKYQHSLSGLTSLKLENEIVLKDNNYTFKGIIDKIMFKEKDNNTYLSLIDYKTGIPKTSINNLIYGIDMQLPIYVYLIKKSNIFLNPKIIGFYLQQILHEKKLEDKKNIDELYKNNLKLNGYSINDSYLVNMFDESYENSEMIKGMKITSKGFSHYTKVLTESEIDNLVNIVDLKIKEAFKEISNFNFSINPKVIDGENIGCSFCKYKDLCFKTGNDLVYLEKYNDLSYLKGCKDA